MESLQEKQQRQTSCERKKEGRGPSRPDHKERKVEERKVRGPSSDRTLVYMSCGEHFSEFWGSSPRLVLVVPLESQANACDPDECSPDDASGRICRARRKTSGEVIWGTF